MLSCVKLGGATALSPAPAPIAPPGYESRRWMGHCNVHPHSHQKQLLLQTYQPQYLECHSYIMISLPIELQIQIIPLLTSTSLIALSQTNRHFRRLIDPQKRQFVNRLLELECFPEYGGEVTINEQAKIIVPPGYVAYACTYCLKILSHTHFDNHSLLRLRFRKPPPESRVGQQLCGWSSGDAKAQGLKRQADLLSDSLMNWFDSSAVPDPTSTKWTQLYHIGANRNRRMCNECKFATGFWARNVGVTRRNWGVRSRCSNVGTATVPVVAGRQRRCHDSTERYFPGLFPVGPEEQYPERWKIYRKANCDWWTLWSIRCAGCGVWQERAAFRKGSAYGVKATPADPDSWRPENWDGPHFEDWRCNHCHMNAVGRKELIRELLEFWKRLVKFEVSMFHHALPSNQEHNTLVKRIVDLEECTRILEADPNKLTRSAMSRNASLI
jgi:hypothetical protein